MCLSGNFATEAVETRVIRFSWHHLHFAIFHVDPLASEMFADKLKGQKVIHIPCLLNFPVVPMGRAKRATFVFFLWRRNGVFHELMVGRAD